MEKELSFFDRIMCAITFAEADEADTAQNFLTPPPPSSKGGVRPGDTGRSTAEIFPRKQPA